MENSDGISVLERILLNPERPIQRPVQTVDQYEALGQADFIPKPIPYFVITDTVQQQIEEIINRIRIGARVPGRKVIGWYGPPGTGKSALAHEIAACLKMPLHEWDLGHGYDLLELIGGTGLRASGGATETSAVEGPLSAAAKVGSIIVLNEVVNVEGIQMSVLHAMLQERVIALPTAEPDRTHSSMAIHQTVKVHPDTFFIFTWNPDLRNPDRQMPPPALLDRLRPRRWEGDSDEDEATKLAAMLSTELDKCVNVEAIRNDVRLIRELRKEYENEGNLARCPYMRTLEDFAATRLTLGEKAAFEVLLNLCDQDPQEFGHQRETLEHHFQAAFGPIGP